MRRYKVRAREEEKKEAKCEEGGYLKTLPRAIQAAARPVNIVQVVRKRFTKSAIYPPCAAAKSTQSVFVYV